MSELEKLFKIVSNQKRLKILEYLLSGDRASLEELANIVGLSYRSVSKSLISFEQSGFLEKEVFWYQSSL